MRQHQASKTPINMYSAYRAMAIDIISDYAMARSFDYLDRDDLGRPWIDMINHATEAAYLTCQFGWLLPVMKSLPFKLVKWLMPDAAAMLGIHKVRYFVHLREASSALHHSFLYFPETLLSLCERIPALGCRRLHEWQYPDLSIAVVAIPDFYFIFSHFVLSGMKIPQHVLTQGLRCWSSLASPRETKFC
jgi:hypothetical protein